MQQAVQNTPSPLERSLTVSVPIAQIEAEIATRLKKLARTAKMERVQRAAKKGDLVNIDFEGLIAGQPFQGNKGENFAVVLGEGRMLPDFESSIEGMTEGETKTFPVTFPQDYAEAVKGKTAD